MVTVNVGYAVLMILVSVGASFVQRVSGFGLAIVAMLFLPYFMPSHAAAVVVSCLLSIGCSAFNSFRFRRHIAFRTLLPMLCSAFVMIPVAIRFSASVPERQMKALLGVALIGLSIYFLFFSGRIHIRPTVRNGVMIGGMSGTLTGLFSTGGPPAVLYLMHATENKTVYFATIQFYFTLSSTYSVVMRAFNGDVTLSLVLYALIGFIGCAAGNILGTKVFDRLDAERVKQVIYVGMIISGILMLV